MSTATMRLRRAGAGGLAAAVIAGTLVAAAGSAMAAAGDNLNLSPIGASPTNVLQGGTAQPATDVQYEFLNNWGTNTTITFTVTDNGVANDCTNATTAANAVSFSAAPTLTLSGPTTGLGSTTAGDSADVKPVWTTKLDSVDPNCTTIGVNDRFTITLTNPSSTSGTNTDAWKLTLGGIKYNVGTTAGLNGVQVAVVSALGATGSPVTNANIINSTYSVSPVVAALPSATGVALGTATWTETTAGAVFPAGATTVTLSLNDPGANFTAGVTPTITVPSGYTTTKPVTTAANTYQFKVTAPATPTKATVTVAGLKADVTATTQTITLDSDTPAGSSAAAINVLDYSKRVGGVDRYATAAAVFNAGVTAGKFPGQAAVLASGALYPDALSANYLAGQFHTGTLLTTPTALPSVTFNALVSPAANVKTVYIVGGTGAVSQAVENQIAATHQQNNPTLPFINVVRLGGIDRYATNMIVNEYQFKAQSVALMATGTNFADALAVGPVAYNSPVAGHGYPLILTNGTSLSAAAKSQLADFGVTTVVIAGGTGAVSSGIETALKGMGITVVRLAGADRTQTAAAVATWLVDGVTTTGVTAKQGFGVSTVHIANGLAFPDALAAGPYAGATSTVIQLAGSPTSLGAGIPQFLGDQTVGVGAVNFLNALGLTGAVSPAVMQAAAASIG